MKIFSDNIESLSSLYVTHLRKALDMEQKITDALPKMIERSTDPELATAFRNHLQQTENHVNLVQALLRNATGSDGTETCKAIGGLITEAEDGMKDAADPAVLDITLIAAGQQVEHHEIAVYGTLRTWASILGLADDAVTLDTILQQEKDADKLLSTISNGANLQAAA
ncbi:MAG TPA: DUF892 family protein [Edaphobacter sp.]